MTLPVPWNWPPFNASNNDSPTEDLAEATPYWVPPATVDDFNDEFDSGSPDLAERGYTVVTGSTVLTRAGDISPNSSPVPGTYWSTIIGSWLYVQGVLETQIDIYKDITLALGDTYFARSVGCYNLSPGTESRYNECGLYAADGAALDNNNRVFNTVKNAPTASYLLRDAGRIQAGNFSGVGERLALGGHDIRGVRFAGGTSHMIFFLDSVSGQPSSIQVAGAPAANLLVRFGVRNAFSSAGTVIPQIWGIDFIRKQTENRWLFQ